MTGGSSTLSPYAYVKRQSWPVWPPTLNKLPSPLQFPLIFTSLFFLVQIPTTNKVIPLTTPESFRLQVWGKHIANPGESVELHCSVVPAGAVQGGTIDWYHLPFGAKTWRRLLNSSNAVLATGALNTLKLSVVKETDSGDYRCQWTGMEGRVVASPLWRLSVKGKLHASQRLP